MSKIGVKFVKGGTIYNLDIDEGVEVSNNDCVVIESVRGVEIAYIAPTTSNVDSEENLKFLRIATEEDLKKIDELKKKVPNVINITNKLIAKYNLDMKLVDVNFTLDGSKVIISYICEDRVDFRELVKDLAYELKLRIELKQIGVRDQAKILGGIGLCGKECCCKQYLNDFDKVSVKMAKVQGLSLNPTKISGLCGRLMCCLAYENDTYAERSTKMPKMNSKVKTKDGVGTVIYNNLLKQLVTVKFDINGEIKINEYELSEIMKPEVEVVKDYSEKAVEEKIEYQSKKDKKSNELQDQSLNQESKQKQENKKHNKFKKKFNNQKKHNESKK